MRVITCDMTEHCTIILPHSRLPNVSRILWEIVFNEDKRLWEVDDLAAGGWPPWLVSSWMLIVCFRVFWFTLLIVNLRSSRWTELSAVCLRNTSKSPLSERLTSGLSDQHHIWFNSMFCFISDVFLNDCLTLHNCYLTLIRGGDLSHNKPQ